MATWTTWPCISFRTSSNGDVVAVVPFGLWVQVEALTAEKAAAAVTVVTSDYGLQTAAQQKVPQIETLQIETLQIETRPTTAEGTAG